MPGFWAMLTWASTTPVLTHLCCSDPGCYVVALRAPGLERYGLPETIGGFCFYPPPFHDEAVKGWGTRICGLFEEDGRAIRAMPHPCAMRLRMDGAPGTRQQPLDLLQVPGWSESSVGFEEVVAEVQGEGDALQRVAAEDSVDSHPQIVKLWRIAYSGGQGDGLAG